MKILATPLGVALAAALMMSAPVGSTQAQSTDVQNPKFTGAAGEIPDQWTPYPPASGANQKIEIVAAGGVSMVDQDEGNGLGLAQWVPVVPGDRISANLVVEGEGGITMNLLFTPNIPAKAAMIDQVAIKKVSGYFTAAKQTPLVATVPDGAKYMRVFIYSPKPGKCSLVLKAIEIKPADGAATDSAASAPAPAPAAPPAAQASGPRAWGTDFAGNPVTVALQGAPETLPPGKVYTIDFEPGDFSQCRLLEGGKKWVVGAPDPVRAGKHSMKVMMTHDQHRTEITGPRTEPYGEYKYGWSVYLPENFDGKTFFSIVTQWHTWGSGKDFPPDGGPPTSITIAGDKWLLKIQHQDGEQFKTAKESIPFGSIEGDKGKWTDFYLEVNWQSAKTGGGYFRLWKNGEKVVDYTGPTWFDDKTKGPFFKMGCYKGGASWQGDEQGTIMFFDEFRMGDKDATREQIDPGKQKS